jgi:1-deoxy-D-xylulose-5-phosphate reductoisomerase
MSTHSKGIAILGSTGSVGCNTLDVIARNPDQFHVVALGVNTSVKTLLKQCQQFRPQYVVVSDSRAAEQFCQSLSVLDYSPQIFTSDTGLEQIVTMPEVDCVMAAIVGAAGLPSTLAAARAGKTILLANKEALVMSGELLIATAQQHAAQLLPIDSEHNAIFQCMANCADQQVLQGVDEIILTASGGPFLNTPRESLSGVTPEQACQHPNWSMGKKISVDSATMMNKGLELIEASLLFNMNIDRVRVLIHPQSVVHALVNYKDGSMLAHMGYPDMRVPIAHAMAWPNRIQSGVQKLDLTRTHLEFMRPDLDKFPCLALAMQVQSQGQSAPTVMNAANEVAVQAFLDEQINFMQIHTVVSRVVDSMQLVAVKTLESILEVDRQARSLTHDIIRQMESL